VRIWHGDRQRAIRQSSCKCSRSSGRINTGRSETCFAQLASSLQLLLSLSAAKSSRVSVYGRRTGSLDGFLQRQTACSATITRTQKWMGGRGVCVLCSHASDTPKSMTAALSTWQWHPTPPPTVSDNVAPDGGHQMGGICAPRTTWHPSLTLASKTTPPCDSAHECVSLCVCVCVCVCVCKHEIHFSTGGKRTHSRSNPANSTRETQHSKVSISVAITLRGACIGGVYAEPLAGCSKRPTQHLFDSSSRGLQ
jgi:hypothetical protein